MEIATPVALAIASGVTVFMLVLSIVMFTSLFTLLVGTVADWIMGVTT